jgi:hypothetical protein
VKKNEERRGYELPYESLGRFAAAKQNSNRPHKKQRTANNEAFSAVIAVSDDAAAPQKEKKKKKQDPRRWKSRPKPITNTTSSEINNNSTDRNTVQRHVLHSICCLSKVTVNQVHKVLQTDPEAIRRPVTVGGQLYQYPLNLAIHFQAESAVIQYLLTADPAVASLPDGPEREGSLHILLRQQRSTEQEQLDLVDSILLSNPIAAQTISATGCLPLHTALFHQASFDTIRHLNMVYPEALAMRNRNRETPIDAACRNLSIVSDDVATYLWEAAESIGHRLCRGGSGSYADGNF